MVKASILYTYKVLFAFPDVNTSLCMQKVKNKRLFNSEAFVSEFQEHLKENFHKN